MSAAGRSRAGRGGGEAGRGLQAAGGAGDLLPGPEGRPACRRHAGRGTVAMTIQGGAGAGCAVGWKGSGGQVPPVHLRAGAAEVTSWPPPPGNRISDNTHTTVGGRARNLRKQLPKWVCLGLP